MRSTEKSFEQLLDEEEEEEDVFDETFMGSIIDLIPGVCISFFRFN